MGEKIAIRLEFINLIVPIKKIDLHYPGGFKAFFAQYRSIFGSKFWHDQYLFRDGTMNPKDTQDLVNFWEERGLTAFEERNGEKWWKDMCVVDFFAGPTLPCDWLQYYSTDHSVNLKVKPKGQVIGREETKASAPTVKVCGLSLPSPR